MTRFGRRDENLPDLMAEAALAALTDAGIERPDGLVVAAMNPEEFTGEGNFASLIATRIGLSHVPALRVETATSSGVAAVYAAYASIAAGFHRSVLVVGGEKMTHVATPRVSDIIGRSIDPYEKSYGTTMPALAGLVTRAAMHRRGLTLREISQVAVKNHAHGARNPFAHFREPVTLETVMESRLVADPLRLFHCCPISDGGAALLLTEERRGSGRAPTRSRCAIAPTSPRSGPPRTRRRPRTAWPASGPPASRWPRSTTPSPRSSSSPSRTPGWCRRARPVGPPSTVRPPSADACP
jgi:acetyl-CoA acetyltransferase